MVALMRPAGQEPGRKFGDRPVAGVSTIRHLGNDYGWGSGRNIFAAADGTVSEIRWAYTTRTNNRSGGYGNYLMLSHGNGFTTLYAHLPTTPMLVRLGQKVSAGDVVASMGNSGNASGVHLHFELRHNGRILDPNPYIGSSSTAGKPIAIVIEPPVEKRRPMSALIRNHDGSIGLATEDGELIPLGSMDEVRALQATGLVGDYVQMGDGLVWNMLTNLTARKLAQRTGSPTAVAGAVAPLLVSAVLAGLKTTGATLTEAQVTEAAEVAIRNVFADVAR